MRTRPFAVLFALLAAAVLPAQADQVADEADFHFNRASAAFRAGKVEDALGEFLASNRLVHNKNVVFNIARCYELLKKPNEAFRWYAEVLGEQDLPAAERDNVLVGVRRLAPSLALVRVLTEPPGASVYVGRRDLGARGRTPVTLALPPGREHLILELEGYRPLETDAELETGQTVVSEHELLRVEGTVAVKGEPSTFDLRADAVDGPVLLRGDGRVRLSPGLHALFAEAPGYAPGRSDVRVVADEETSLQLKLVPLPPPSGSLVVRSNVDGALLTLDGREVGFTPAVLDGVRVGHHRLKISAEGREPIVLEVDLAEKERLLLDPQLRYALPRVLAAERQLTLATDAPSSITILTAAEIRSFGWITLAEALRSVRGLFTTDDRSYLSLGVRGYSAPGTYNNRVLVLSDGHTTNDLSNGQGFIGQDFDTDLADVDRIEIVRGAGSVLYGSAAFLAVVNVVHRTPGRGLHGALSATSLDQSGIHGELSARGEGRWIAIRAGASAAQGETSFRSPMPEGSPAGSPTGFAHDVDGERAVHADLRAKLGDFSFSASINDRTKDVPTAPFNTVFGLTGTSNRDQAFFAELGWEHELGAGVVADVRVSYDGRRHTSLLELTGTSTAPLGPDAGYAGSNDRVADWLDAEVRLRSPSLWGNRLYLGAEVQNAFRVQLNSFSPTSSLAGYAVSPPSDLSETVLSAYAGDDLELASWLRLSLAVRVDDHGASFGATANPRVAAILQPVAGGNLKLIYGTAYRAPSFYERYFTNGVSQLPGNRPSATGTPAVLQPETVRTGEFEYAQRLHEDFSVLVAGYWSRIEGILRLASFPGNPKLFAFGNRTTLTHSAGLEGEARWQPEPGLLVSAWYAWARVTNDSGSLVPNVPVHSAAVRLLLPVLGEALSFSTEAVYTSSRLTVRVDAKNVEVEVGEQLAWNVGLAGQAGRLRYGALVQNLLDNHPLEPAGLEVPFSPRAVPQPGRTLRLHVGGSF